MAEKIFKGSVYEITHMTKDKTTSISIYWEKRNKITAQSIKEASERG